MTESRATDNTAEHLMRLKQAQKEADRLDGPSRWHVVLIVAGILCVVLVTTIAGIAALRLHYPSTRLLADGWYHVTDAEWGFECELPSTYNQTRELGKWTRYSNRTFSVYAARRKANESAIAEMNNAVERDRLNAEVTILPNPSTDGSTSMIDYVIKRNQQSFRCRMMIRGDTVVTTTVSNLEYLDPRQVRRIVDSVKWKD